MLYSSGPPDRSFHNSRAAQSGDRPILFTSAKSLDGCESSKHVNGSVGGGGGFSHKVLYIVVVFSSTSKIVWKDSSRNKLFDIPVTVPDQTLRNFRITKYVERRFRAHKVCPKKLCHDPSVRTISSSRMFKRPVPS